MIHALNLHGGESFVELSLLPKEFCFTIYEDNQAAIYFSNSQGSRKKQHMAVRYFRIRESVQEGLIKLTYVNTREQLADIMTKNLTVKKFWASVLDLMGQPL